MILYHFTALEYLDAILAEGLTKGDVPLTQTQGDNAVWFTSDTAPEGHGLTDGHVLTVEEREAYRRSFGEALSEGARFPDKRRVRIEVAIPSSDRRLKSWLPWARKRLSPDWLTALSAAGGGKAKARTWFIYQGAVPPTLFRTVMVCDAAGVYQPHTD
ncbi:hypothetical protein [Methylobacterium sp. WL6]|uniref:hypothetical protein n=1 Tax=Methylobacterium sp. WL6 TaxID=2603901 RepID=UPI0011C9038D|nr:hypothetical protein [Methylobacterium sp. WL6]TXN64892.1 hypothetical protein FV230_17740 [Methylobacterium sp. WL6]